MKRTTLPKKATTVLALPECWIHEENYYNHLKNSVRAKNLPRIEKEYEGLLKEMKIPYRVIKCMNGIEVCEYWNPECVQTTEVTLPLYEQLYGVYQYTGRFYTSKVNSQLMIKKAFEIEEKVVKQKNEFKKRVEVERYFKETRKLVKGKQAVGAYVSGLNADIAKEISDEEIKVLPVRYANNNISEYFAIFNLAEIEGREGRNVRMEVPRGLEGLFIGRAQWQVREWTELYWAKKFHVEKIWVVGL